MPQSTHVMCRTISGPSVSGALRSVVRAFVGPGRDGSRRARTVGCRSSSATRAARRSASRMSVPRPTTCPMGRPAHTTLPTTTTATAPVMPASAPGMSPVLKPAKTARAASTRQPTRTMFRWLVFTLPAVDETASVSGCATLSETISGRKPNRDTASLVARGGLAPRAPREGVRTARLRDGSRADRCGISRTPHRLY